MERRTFLIGAAGLMVANQDVAKSQANTDANVEKTERRKTETDVVGVYSHIEPELSNSLVVALKARNEEKYLDIWIGQTEGLSISAYLQREKSPAPVPTKKLPRPLSPDFTAELVKSLGGDIESVSISLEDDIYYATTMIIGNGKTMKVDGRPSDAINLALRFAAPIFVECDLLKLTSLEQLGVEVRKKAAEQAKFIKEQTKPQ